MKENSCKWEKVIFDLDNAKGTSIFVNVDDKNQVSIGIDEQGYVNLKKFKSKDIARRYAHSLKNKFVCKKNPIIK